jgi:hypothetical protein
VLAWDAMKGWLHRGEREIAPWWAYKVIIITVSLRLTWRWRFIFLMFCISPSVLVVWGLVKVVWENTLFLCLHWNVTSCETHHNMLIWITVQPVRLTLMAFYIFFFLLQYVSLPDTSGDQVGQVRVRCHKKRILGVRIALSNFRESWRVETGGSRLCKWDLTVIQMWFSWEVCAWMKYEGLSHQCRKHDSNQKFWKPTSLMLRP